MVLNRKMIYQDFMRTSKKNYKENSNVGYFLAVDVEYPQKLFSSHKELSFLPERKNQKK